MRLRKVRTIASFELRATVLRLSYLVTTLLFPLLLLGVSFGTLAIQDRFVGERASEHVDVGLHDGTGLVRGEAREGTTRFHAVASRAEGLVAIREGRLDSFYEVATDWPTSGRVTAYVNTDPVGLGVAKLGAERDLERLLLRRLLEREGDATLRERVLDPLHVEDRIVTAHGIEVPGAPATTRALATLVVPFLLGVLLLSALLVSSGYLVQAVVTDKETKIVEVLLSSAGADEILFGKLLGLGAAGLLQFLVWAFFAAVLGSTALAMIPGAATALPLRALAFAPLFFVLGYLFVGSLMLATGSLGSNAAETQKLTVGWVMLAVLPMMFLVPMLDDPHGTVGRVLSLVPWSAPLAVVIRLAIDPDGLPAWELALSVLILLASTAIAIRVGARIFRIGFLLSGERPRLRALLAQARLGQ